MGMRQRKCAVCKKQRPIRDGGAPGWRRCNGVLTCKWCIQHGRVEAPQGPAPITHVAIRFRGVTYSLPAPNRHHDVIRLIVQQTGVSHVDSHGGDQGFLDADGYYLGRAAALARASLVRQLKDPAQVRLGLLFSEDLW